VKRQRVVRNPRLRRPPQISYRPLYTKLDASSALPLPLYCGVCGYGTRSAEATGRQIITALMYSIGMFEDRDVFLTVSAVTTRKPDFSSNSQTCFSVITFLPNPFGGFSR
jgi:hypothetical protein